MNDRCTSFYMHSQYKYLNVHFFAKIEATDGFPKLKINLAGRSLVYLHRLPVLLRLSGTIFLKQIPQINQSQNDVMYKLCGKIKFDFFLISHN